MNMQHWANGLFFLLLLTLGACANNAADSADAPISGKKLDIGEKAPDFELQDFEGRTHRLSTMKRADGTAPRGYVVIFTNLNCPFGKAYERRAMKLFEEYKFKGYVMAMISLPYEGMKEVFSEEQLREQSIKLAYPFTYLKDPEGMTAAKFGATVLPEVFLLDADRKLRYNGLFDDNVADPYAVKSSYINNAINALEEGLTPQTPKTQPSGCFIKAPQEE